MLESNVMNMLDTPTMQKEDATEDQSAIETQANPVYGNTKRSSEFTSENHKIEIINLPLRPKFHVVKHLLERQFKLAPHKIRLGQHKAFVAFKTEQERDEAIAKLNNQKWKDKTLIARIATPRNDLLANKRKDNDDKSDDDDHQDGEIEDDAINAQVCPLWSKDYADQIETKDKLVRSVLNMSREIHKMSENLEADAPALFQWVKDNEKICCKFDGIEKSPVVVGYRNKCEFNIGHDCSVGFKIGRYRNGSNRVCRPPNNCPILTKTMFDIIDTFKTFLESKTTLKPYDVVTHEGNYRQLTIRCNQNDEYLAIVDLHPQGLSEDEINAEIEVATKCLKSIAQIISIYFNISEECQFSSANQSLKLVYGEPCLYEYLSIDPSKLLKFRIGPASFFQVNTRAAELLYRSIIDMAQLNPSSMVIDFGCGTGTIGLSLAKSVNHVIGIEIVESAIKDARANAEENGISNVTFFAGRAEQLIGESISIMKNKLEYQRIDGEIVAIVDPPRVGFNTSFIKTIRASTIKKIIYIACDPKANNNLTALCRPRSKAYQGEPFVPTRAKAFDLFPHTKCCELVLVYERLNQTGA